MREHLIAWRIVCGVPLVAGWQVTMLTWFRMGSEDKYWIISRTREVSPTAARLSYHLPLLRVRTAVVFDWFHVLHFSDNDLLSVVVDAYHNILTCVVANFSSLLWVWVRILAGLLELMSAPLACLSFDFSTIFVFFFFFLRYWWCWSFLCLADSLSWYFEIEWKNSTELLTLYLNR